MRLISGIWSISLIIPALPPPPRPHCCSNFFLAAKSLSFSASQFLEPLSSHAMAAMAQASFVATPARLGASTSVSRTGDCSSRLQFAGRTGSIRLASASPKRSLVARAAVADIEDLLEKVKGLTLADAKVLSDRLSADLGISALSFGAPAAAAPAGGAAGEATAAVEEKTEFDLSLDEVPAASRIAVIKAVRTLTTLGLKEAKDIIDALPKKVKEGIAKEEAEEAKKVLEAAGAKCSIK